MVAVPRGRAKPQPRTETGSPRTSTLRRSPLLVALAVIAVGAGSWSLRPAVAAMPPDARLVIADLRGHTLLVTDTNDPTHARRIALEGGPHEMALLPDGRVAVSLEQSGAIAIVDVSTGATRTLDIGGLPHGIALTGSTLYVTDRSTNRLRRFDIADWHEGASVSADAWPHALVTLPGGSLAVANAAADTLTIAGKSVPVSHVPETIAVASDGRVATAGSLGGAVQVFSAQGDPLGWHDVGGRPVRVLFAPDDRTIAAALSADGAVALIDGDAVRRVEVGGVPDGLAFSPDGRWLYAGDDAGGVVTVVDVQRGVAVTRFEAGQSAGAILELPRS